VASLDYDFEKNYFREFYNDNLQILGDAKSSFCALITALVSHSGDIAISKIEGRVKDKEECLSKFNLKYRKELESNETLYSIRDHISDLIGLRVVCLYEDDIDKIKNVLDNHFEVIDVTDKTSQIEKTEGSFGYKGLHLDLKLGSERREMPEYKSFVDFNFEIQIRTIVQDSWSVLDHKIKYKKKIPNKLKRRINTLAALFELADREFLAIRSETEFEIQKAEEDDADEVLDTTVTGPLKLVSSSGNGLLTAFGLLKIANHFFTGFDAESYKVDGFTDEIVSLEPEITRTKLNTYMKEGISKVKLYKTDFEENANSTDTLNPYTIIRHCLYLGNRDTFTSVLTNASKETFDKWLVENND
jgi:putative GTP pyrophosphokinase